MLLRWIGGTAAACRRDRRRHSSVNVKQPTDGTPSGRQLQDGTEAERTAYTPPQGRVLNHAVEPRRADEGPDNIRTHETESSRIVIQPMSGSAPTAR